MRGIAVGGPLHGQVIESSRPVEIAEEVGYWPLGNGSPLDTSMSFKKGQYRPEKLGFHGSPKPAFFWVYDKHTTEAAQGMAWEMLLEAAQQSYSNRKETRFP
jgi:hypothetical protein